MRLCYSDPVLVFATISTLPYSSIATPLLLRPPSSSFGTPRATYLTIIYVSIYDRSFDEPSESFSSPAYDSRSQPTLLHTRYNLSNLTLLQAHPTPFSESTKARCYRHAELSHATTPEAEVFALQRMVLSLRLPTT